MTLTNCKHFLFPFQSYLSFRTVLDSSPPVGSVCVYSHHHFWSGSLHSAHSLAGQTELESVLIGEGTGPFVALLLVQRLGFDFLVARTLTISVIKCFDSWILSMCLFNGTIGIPGQVFVYFSSRLKYSINKSFARLQWEYTSRDHLTIF